MKDTCRGENGNECLLKLDFWWFKTLRNNEKLWNLNYLKIGLLKIDVWKQGWRIKRMKTGGLWDCMPKVALHGYSWKTSNAPRGEWKGHSYQAGWKMKFLLLFLSPRRWPHHKEFMHMESGRKWAKAGLGGVVEKFHCQERMRLVSPVVTSSQLGSLSWEESINLTS